MKCLHSQPVGVAVLASVVLSAGLLLSACSPSDAPQGAAVELPGTVSMVEQGSPFVAFDIWFKVGSQDDPKGKEGLAALTANLLSDSGSERFSYQEILEKLYPMATSWTSTIDKEMTTFRGVVHRDHQQAYYELFRDSLLAPGFKQEDFDRVKSQTMNFLERGRRFQRDEELSKELLFWRAYRGTPYEHPEEGYVQSVARLTLEDVQDFYRSHYLRSAVVVGVGGGVESSFVKTVRTDFDSLPEGQLTRVAAPQPAPPEGVKILIVEKETAATAISIGFPIEVTRAHPDFHELMLVNSWFGEHRSSFSHLYQVIRERRGMNYGDYSYIEAFPRGYTTQDRPVNVSRRSQLFEIWIRPISGTGPGTMQDRALFATRAALRELSRLVEGGLPDEQVERTRNYLQNFALNYGSTTLRRLAFAIDDEFYDLPAPGYLASLRGELGKVTTESVAEAVEKHLASKGIWIVLITQDAEAMKQKLLSGEATNITYAGEQPAEILAEDKEIASFEVALSADDIEILDISEVFEGQ